MATALSLTGLADNMKDHSAQSAIRIFASKLTDRTYLSATLYWVLRKLTGVQFHQVFAIDVSAASANLQLSKPFLISVLACAQDIDLLPAGMESQLNEQSGLSCRALCERGALLYFIHDGKDVACQLNIRNSDVVVDSPTHLNFQFAANDAFLNYLFTRDTYRGQGLARQLILYACADLARRGKRRCFAHIRATNHASLSAFQRSGWRQCCKLITTTTGRFLAAPGCRKSGMTVSPVTHA